MQLYNGALNYEAHWKLHPRWYHVSRIVEPIVVDGNVDKEPWSVVPWSETFGDIASGDPAKGTTQFKALYDDTYLYIAALLQPASSMSTEAHFVDRNSPIFQKDSDFEVFIDLEQSTHNYKELEINALGTVWNLLLDKPYNDGGVEHSGRIAQPGEPLFYDVACQHSGVRVVHGRLNTPGSGAIWSTELALAWSDLRANTTGLMVVPPPILRINFSRVEKQGDVNWTWQRQVQWDPSKKSFRGKVNMHMPDAWGYFVLDPSLQQHDSYRDAYWPVRCTAAAVYYAMHHFKQQNGMYTANVDKLILPEDIMSPFDVSIALPGPNSFVATVSSKIDSTAAEIRSDRRITTNSRTTEEATALVSDSE